jgi:hypothetical protein
MARLPGWAAVAALSLAPAIGPAATHAAAPWSEPQPTTAGFSELAFDAAGQGTLFGLTQTPGAIPVDRIIGAPVVAGTVGATRASRARINLTALRLDGTDGVVAAGDSTLEIGAPHHVAVTRGRIGGPLSRPRALGGSSVSSWLLDLAVNQGGDAAVAVRWCHTRGCGRQSLRLFRWRAGARVGRPLRIARGRKLGAAVALNERGDVALVWDRVVRDSARRDVYGQFVSAVGRVRPRQRLAGAPTAPRYRLELTNRRRVVAGWVAQPVSECDAGRGEIAVLASAAPGRFGRSQRLAKLDITGCGRYAAGPGVAFARRPGSGRVLVAWSGNEGRRWVVRAGQLGPAGVTGATVVSDRATDAVLADLAVGQASEAVVLLADGIGGADPTGPRRLLAATRAAGAAFGAAEVVAPDAGLGSVVEIDPATHRPTVAFPGTTDAFAPVTYVTVRDPVTR